MKKIISFLLTIIICLGFFSFSASAANEKIVAKAVPSKSTVAVGDTFTVDFNLTTNAGFYTLGFEVSYDESILEVVCPNHKEGSNCTGSRSPVKNKYKMSGVSNSASDSRYHTSTPYKIMWGFSLAEEDCTYLGCMATLTFKVKSLPTSNKTTISLVVDQSSSIENGKYSSAERSGVGATITITCSKHSFSAWKQTKAATCTQKGSESRTCSICNKSETRDIAMKAHSFGDWVTSKKATCVEAGQESRSCTNCGFKEIKTLNKLGHNLQNAVVTKKPTCESAGQQTRSCARCDYKETKTLEKLTHAFQKPVITKEPTCTETGLETGKCINCNKQTHNVLKAKGHKFSDFVVVESTCTKEGKKQGVCSVCGIKSEEKLPLKAHSFPESVVIKEATETEPGVKTSTCTVCGEVKKETIPAKENVLTPLESLPSFGNSSNESSVSSEQSVVSLIEQSDVSSKTDDVIVPDEEGNDKSSVGIPLVAVGLILVVAIIVVIVKRRYF